MDARGDWRTPLVLTGLGLLLGAGASACSSDETGTPGFDLSAGAGAGTGAGAGGEGGLGAGAGWAGQGGGWAGGGGQGGGGAEPWQPVQTDWCVDEGWLGLGEDLCFYAPPSLGASAGLLVFLHGMLPPDGSPETMQWLVRQAADDGGFAALFPRGEQGLCAWDPSVEDWWCWPTSRQSVDAETASFTAEWDQAELLLEDVLGLSVTARYVLGFSNGGYFASYIGLEGLWPVSGAGLIAAGRSYVDESLLWDEEPPFYIAVGDEDSVAVQNSAQNLAFVLSQEGWPHEYVVHPGRGHWMEPGDLQSAWALWMDP